MASQVSPQRATDRRAPPLGAGATLFDVALQGDVTCAQANQWLRLEEQLPALASKCRTPYRETMPGCAPGIKAREAPNQVADVPAGEAGPLGRDTTRGAEALASVRA